DRWVRSTINRTSWTARAAIVTPKTPAETRRAVRSVIASPFGDRDRTHHGRSAAARRTDLQRASDRVESVGHPLEPGSVAGRGGIESPAVVGDLEREAALALREPDVCTLRVRVLLNVLE